MISVVIITYNRSGILERCLSSLMKQSVHPHEIIVVDDGSTDDTADVVSSFDVRYVNQNHAGIAAARNMGISKVTGNVIAFIDDDCIADKDWIRYMKKAFSKYPDVAAISGAVENGVDSKIHWVYHMLNFSKWLRKGRPRPINDAPTANTAYRMRNIDGLSFSGGISDRGEDTLFNMALREKDGHILFYPDTLVYHAPDMDSRRLLSAQKEKGRLFMSSGYKAFGIKGRMIKSFPLLGALSLTMLYYAKDCLGSSVYRYRFIRYLPFMVKGEFHRLRGMMEVRG